jgi:hypothetical protein
LLKQKEKQEKKAAKLVEQQAALEKKREEREERERVAALARCRVCSEPIEPPAELLLLPPLGSFHRSKCAPCHDCHRFASPCPPSFSSPVLTF